MIRYSCVRVWVTLIALAALVSACRGDRPVTQDIDVRELGTEEARRVAASHELLSQLRMFDVPDRVIYEAPAPLEKPAGATEWPPPAQPAAAAPAPAPAQRDTTVRSDTAVVR